MIERRFHPGDRVVLYRETLASPPGWLQISTLESFCGVVETVVPVGWDDWIEFTDEHTGERKYVAAYYLRPDGER